MKHLYLLVVLGYLTPSYLSDRGNDNVNFQKTTTWNQPQTHGHSNNFPRNSEILAIPPAQWYKELYRADETGELTSHNYKRPAVLKGGLLSAQVPRHTLIAIDRFLKILKSLAGFAILIAIGMPIIHEITSSIFEVAMTYL